MINQLDQAARDPRLLSEYMSFSQSYRWLTRSARVSKDLGGGPAGMTLQMPGGQRLDLTSAETAIVRMLQNGRLGPALALRVIGANPDLKTKLDGIGGIDALFGPNAARPGPSPEFSEMS